MTARSAKLPVLCVFPHAPIAPTSGVSIRRRRLAQQISPLGPSLAVVLQPMDERDRAALEGELGVPVVAVDVPRRDRMRAFAHWLGHPSVPWGIARIDTAVARRLIVDQLGGLDPAIVWCAGLEAWRALPGAFRRRAVVDVVDLPSRYSASSPGSLSGAAFGARSTTPGPTRA